MCYVIVLLLCCVSYFALFTVALTTSYCRLACYIETRTGRTVPMSAAVVH